jgi:type I restriction enzyme S subunit
MSSEWPTVTIDEIKAESKNAITIGPFGSRMKSDCYVGSGVAVIRGTNLGPSPKFINNFVYITGEKADELATCNVFRDDLVFPHRGSIGEVGIVDDDLRYVLSSSLMKLTCDRTKAFPKFIYYFFKSSLGRHELLKNASQVGTPGIGQPLTSLKSIELPLPPLKIQENTATTLGLLDDKIQLNHQINQTLEQMAQAVFKSWFVDFEPVKAKIAALEAGGNEEDALLAAMQIIAGDAQECANAAKGSTPAAAIGGKLARLRAEQPEQYAELRATAELFPSAMQDSELGEIPEGWGAGLLGESVTVKRGGSPRPIKDYIVPDGLPWVKIADATAESSPFLFKTREFIKEEGLRKTVYLSKGALILSNSATPGLPKFLDIDACIHDGWLYFPSVRIFTGEYLYFLFLKLRSELVSQGNGSVFTNLKTDILKNQRVTIPPESLIELFSRQARSLLSQIRSSRMQTNSLSEMRDTLLPRLLSGELPTSEAESDPAESEGTVNV